MQTYSPFDKSIKDLNPDDLAVLKTVNEGWYVEYKRELVSARALAKAVSSFANTYGGWLFLGVQERSPDEPVAGSFPGIPDTQVDGALQRLRQSVAEHLNPAPYFETKTLQGPCLEIGLAESSSLIAIEIPQSHTAPHVHKDGRIYRRVGDSSEPKPETDRFILDQLWRRADNIREMTRKWIERDPEFTEQETKMPCVRLLLCVDPWFQRVPWIDAPLSEIRSILTSQEMGSPSLAFDTVYPTTSGFIARQLEGNDPHNYGLTWRMRRNLSCDIVLPLQLYTPHRLNNLISEWDGYKYVDIFTKILKAQGHTQPQIADLNFMLHILIAIVSKYRRLLKLVDEDAQFYFKARLLNVGRIVPFIDIETILEEFKKYGLPMVLDSIVTLPVGDDPESFSLVTGLGSKHDEHHQEPVINSVDGIAMFIFIAEGFGMSVNFNKEPEDKNILYDELTATCDRAMAVQRNRNKQQT